MLPQPIKLFSKFNEVRNISWTLVCYARPLILSSGVCRMRVRLYKIFLSKNSCHPIFFSKRGMKKNFSEKLNLFWQASQEFLYPSIKYENLGKRKKRRLACKLHQEAIVSSTLFFSVSRSRIKASFIIRRGGAGEGRKKPTFVQWNKPPIETKVRVFPYPGAIQFTSSYFPQRGRKIGVKNCPPFKWYE